ncbi:signal transduction histidine kinase [Microbacterium ginsengiterrae]|uniref:Signal transduction histidine kinase n=1 Tax=Microbacterium ginsengiterrae TaxID=546115 RepID=A0A7W9CCQ6_9MICO|nr:histidine kinase [Microbacterium ginsengiterrae]MBB5743195.1 signal transduction histidine kinase [Microbacterium ginsengiterrae]
MNRFPATVGVGHRAGRRADDLARYAILGLSLAVGVVTVISDELAVQGWLWSGVLVAWFLTTNLAVSRRPGRAVRLALYGCAVLASWALLLTVSSRGSLVVILLIAVAAIGSSLLPLPWVLAVVTANCVVVLVHAWSTGADALDGIGASIFYLVIHLAVVFTAYAMSREALLRAELEQKNVALEAASVLLEDSTAASERLRISRDLHDSIGHQLTVLNLELTAARHRLDADADLQREGPAVRAHVRRAGGVAKDLLTDVRTTVGELRAAGPVDLRRDLERLARAVPSLQIHVAVDEGIDAGEQTCAAVVRAAQEIITNTIKHAEATELELELVREEDRLVLRGANDGTIPAGITPGHGLTGLSERLALLGGELVIRTTDQFTVEARLPLDPERRAPR